MAKTYVFSMTCRSGWNVCIQYGGYFWTGRTSSAWVLNLRGTYVLNMFVTFERNLRIQYDMYFWRDRRYVTVSMTSSFEQKTRIQYDVLIWSECIYSVWRVDLDRTCVFSMTRRSGWNVRITVLYIDLSVFSMSRRFRRNVCIQNYT